MNATETATETETVETRATRLAPKEKIADTRLASLARAHALGVDDILFARLIQAGRLSFGASVTLPAGRYDHCSRGKGWAGLRKGSRGPYTAWGESVRGGYVVDLTGTWTVGSSDGFDRKDTVTWDVSRVEVGDTQIWVVE